MLLGACINMNEYERNICTREMIRGFYDTCTEAGTVITGGQTVLNPWPIIGGVATSIVSKNEFFTSNHIEANDVVLLTKPLGTQIAVNVHQWYRNKDNNIDNNTNNNINNIWWNKCQSMASIVDDDVNHMMNLAIQSMITLNKNAASLLMKYHATACTDVTGFGIVGHAQNLMDNQIHDNNIGNNEEESSSSLIMQIHTLPCIIKTPIINEHVMDFQLLKGYSAETSGGLLICMSHDNAIEYIKELYDIYHVKCWMIGNVISRSNASNTINNNNNVKSKNDGSTAAYEIVDDNNNNNNDEQNNKTTTATSTTRQQQPQVVLLDNLNIVEVDEL